MYLDCLKMIVIAVGLVYCFIHAFSLWTSFALRLHY